MTYEQNIRHRNKMRLKQNQRQNLQKLKRETTCQGIKIFVFPELFYEVNAESIQMPMGLFLELKRSILKLSRRRHA